jgi:hypothetical protein
MDRVAPDAAMVETLRARMQTTAGKLCAAVRSAPATELARVPGPMILITDCESLIMHRISQVDARVFAELYTDYAVAAGDAFAYGAMPTMPSAPTIHECSRGDPGTFCLQFGPFDFFEPEKACSRIIMHDLSMLVGKIVSDFSSGVCRHDIYLGFSSPPSGPGKVSIYAWVPTFTRSRNEMSQIRAMLADTVAARQHATPPPPPLFRDSNGAPLLQANRGMPAAPLTDTIVSATLRKSGRSAGSNGIVPLLWCADPGTCGFGTKETSYPICPYVGFLTYTAVEGADGLVKELTFNTTLEGCLDPRSSAFYGQVFEGKVQICHEDTNAWSYQDQINDPLAHNLGCRTFGHAEKSTYDTLPLVLSAAFVAREGDSAPSGDLGSTLFSSCNAGTPDKYNVHNLLRLLSSARLDTSTPRGLGLCSEILEALIGYYHLGADGEAPMPRDRAMPAAMGLLENAAKMVRATLFDREALAKHHSQNYEGRPGRSRRVIAHYAQVDCASIYAELFGTRIWEKFMNITSQKDQVCIAEALAVFLAADHYIIPSPVKTQVQLFVYRNPVYVAVSDPKNYISSLLSTDGACGRLFNLILKVHSRLTTLVGAKAPPPAAGAMSGAEVEGVEKGANVGSKGALMQALNALSTIMQLLKTPPYKNSLVTEILTKLHQEQESFLGVVDRTMGDDPYLTGVGNGTLEVIRCGTRRHIFHRQSTPDDMVTAKLRTIYDPSAKGTKRWEYVERYFRRFIANPRIRTWYICQLAEMFVGRSNKVATFLVGSPNCGKTIHLNHIIDFLGTAVESIPANVFSDPKAGTDAPQASLTRAANARIATCEETSEIIRNAMFKIVAGGGAKTALRGLYSSGASQEFQAKLIIAMNKHPIFELFEDAIFARMGIVEPSPKYVDAGHPSLPTTEEEREAKGIYAKDPAGSALFKGAYDAFLIYLMMHFDTWTDDGGSPALLSAFPKEMEDARNKVRRQCPFADFNARYLVAASPEESVPVINVIKRFREYHMKGGARYTDTAIINGIKTLISCPPHQDGTWHGWRLKASDEIDGELMDEPADFADAPYPDMDQVGAYPGGTDAYYHVPPTDRDAPYGETDDDEEGIADVGDWSGNNQDEDYSAQWHCV